MWTKETILNMLETNDRAVTRAVIAIYRRQTLEEQNAQATIKNNGVGFTGADAGYLSYCAQYALRHRRDLSGKHLEKSRKRIKKYWRQLLEIANTQQKTREVTQ